METLFALFLVMNFEAPHDPVTPPDLWYAVDGSLTASDCEDRKAELLPAVRALYGDTPHAVLVCDVDHAPGEW